MSVILNGKSYLPAPFVSTNYEYNKVGDYIIGGFLIVTLSGKVVSDSVLKDLTAITLLQSSNSCVSLSIGCESGEFLNNASGKIRSVDVSVDDQPFIGSYTIVIAVETINDKPAVSPDSQFLKSACLTNADYIQSYNETISIAIDANALCLVDDGFGLSKSFAKANGQITIVSLSKLICGKPEYTNIDNLISILEQRAASLLSLQPCEGSILSKYAGWSKWIDTQSLDINSGTGTVTWSFEIYMSPGLSAPYAWADINTEDRYDHKKRIVNRTVSGTIKGLSASTTAFLANKTNSSERLRNAEKAFSFISSKIINGTWPSDITLISGQSGSCDTKSDPCENTVEPTCFQRISSNINKSVVAGEISFTSEFGSISSCKINQVAQIDVTMDETVGVTRYAEIFTPNGRRSTVVEIGDTPSRVTITGKGTLKGCDRSRMTYLKNCVTSEMNKNIQAYYRGWSQIKQIESFGTYSYSKTMEFIKCG